MYIGNVEMYNSIKNNIFKELNNAFYFKIWTLNHKNYFISWNSTERQQFLF